MKVKLIWTMVTTRNIVMRRMIVVITRSGRMTRIVVVVTRRGSMPDVCRDDYADERC